MTERRGKHQVKVTPDQLGKSRFGSLGELNEQVGVVHRIVCTTTTAARRKNRQKRSWVGENNLSNRFTRGARESAKDVQTTK
jgi:hypothetical protein